MCIGFIDEKFRIYHEFKEKSELLLESGVNNIDYFDGLYREMYYYIIIKINTTHF